MKKRLTYVSPIQLGIVEGVLMGVISLITVPFLKLGAMFGHSGPGIVLAVFIPILYANAGFIGGIITAAVCNVVAK